MKGDYLFQQGDQVVHFHYVKSGKVKLTRDTIEGSQVLIYVAMPGESIAEASLFFDEYHCSAVADSESVVVAYRKSTLLAYLEQNPAAMKDMLKVFAGQVRALRAINEIKNIRSAKERILAFIRHTMNEHQEVHLEMSLKDIAYQIGLAHETFYRELKKLEQDNILIRKEGYLKLL
jgi:CRP-like cAMP-binding protein